MQLVGLFPPPPPSLVSPTLLSQKKSVSFHSKWRKFLGLNDGKLTRNAKFLTTDELAKQFSGGRVITRGAAKKRNNDDEEGGEGEEKALPKRKRRRKREKKNEEEEEEEASSTARKETEKRGMEKRKWKRAKEEEWRRKKRLETRRKEGIKASSSPVRDKQRLMKKARRRRL